MNEDYLEEYSELRYITLELMKMAYAKNISFRKIAREYVKNINTLYRIIQEEMERDE